MTVVVSFGTHIRQIYEDRPSNRHYQSPLEFQTSVFALEENFSYEKKISSMHINVSGSNSPVKSANHVTISMDNLVMAMKCWVEPATYSRWADNRRMGYQCATDS